MREWQQFLLELESRLGKKAVDEWVRPLRVVRFDAANLYLEAPNPMAASWFEEHVRPLAKTKFFNENNRFIKIHLTNEPKRTPSAPIQTERRITPDSIDPIYTLQNFGRCPANEIAYRLLNDWVEKGKALFNPIFIYGPKNSGKTHLLMGVATSFLTQGKKVFYVRANTFTEHVVQAIRASQMQEFRKIYREIDILLIDDIHHLSGRAATQEEFFHTFNTLHTAGKQIVLTSLLPPSKLTEIEPRLTSRFEWGLSIGIEKAPFELSLPLKAAAWNLPLSGALSTYLVEHFPSDPVTPLQALALRSNGSEPLTPSAAALLLKDLEKAEAAKSVTPEKIVKAISTFYGITPEDLLGKAQSKEFALPRQIAMYAIREKLKMPFQAMGKFFSRDHSTVMSSVKQIQSEIENKNQNILDALAFASKE